MKEKRGVLAAIIFCIVLCCGTGCTPSPFRIGFVGGLSGTMSDLGISGRDSLQLAAEVINEQGGIDGRSVELVIRDDRNDPDEAKKAVRELIDEDVRVIIGHMTSTMTQKTVPIANEHQVLMISPTTSTPELSGIDDYFLRVMPENTKRIIHKVEYILTDRTIRTLSAIIDVSNQGYTVPYWEQFKTSYLEKSGGTISDVVHYNSNEEVDYTHLVEKIVRNKPDALLFIANAFDTAMFCQQAAKLNYPGLLITCGWANTQELIQYGGRAVEGLFFVTVAPAETKPEYETFKETFNRKYGYTPAFAAVNTYDAAMIVKQAYEQKKRGETLKDAIIRIGMFQGLQMPVFIDKYGDAARKYNRLIVKDGEFVRLE